MSTRKREPPPRAETRVTTTTVVRPLPTVRSTQPVFKVPVPKGPSRPAGPSGFAFAAPSFLSEPSFSTGPSFPTVPKGPVTESFSYVPPGPIAGPEAREKFEREQREERERQQNVKRNLQATQEQFRLQQEQEELMRQARINAYLEKQRELGIPNELYIELNDQVEVQVYRYLNVPDQFWVIKRDPRGGIGKIITVENRPRFQWVQVHQVNPDAAKLMLSQPDFPFFYKPKVQRIAEEVAAQREAGIQDTIYVKLGDELIVTVYRNPASPLDFWVDAKNEGRGRGRVIRQADGGFRFKWDVISQYLDKNLAKLMQTQVFPFSISPPPAPSAPSPAQATTPSATKPPPTQVTRPTREKEREKEREREIEREKPREKEESEEFLFEEVTLEKIPSVSGGERQRPVRRPSLEGRSGVEIVISKEMEDLLKQKDALEKRARVLSRVLAKPERVLEKEQEDIRRDEELARIKVQALEMERELVEERLQEQAEKELGRQMGEFKTKRLRELEEENEELIKEIRQDEQEQRENLQKLRKKVAEADPEKRLERAEEELEKTREQLAKAELKQRQLDQMTAIQTTINRRLFSNETRQPRTLAELIAKLPERNDPNGLQEYALRSPEPTRMGKPINAVEDVLSIDEQKQLVRIYLCGRDEGKKHIPGYFESVLKVKQDECRVII